MKKSSSLLLFLLLCLTPVLAEAPRYEEPVKLKASEVLPPELLVGPNHKVEGEVLNDGYLNVYTVNSKWGQLEVVSTPVLRKRIHELNAMAEMEKLKGSKEFKSGVKKAGKKVVQGAEQIVTDPGGTVKNVGKGIGGIFKSIGKTVTGKGDGHGDNEGNTLERVSGFSKVKRQYAAGFGVDPYSRNEYLQNELGEISKAGFLGGTITSLGLGAIGGTVVSVASNADSFNDMVHSQSPGKLRKFNRKKLKKMGVSEDVRDLFIRNKNYTVTQQTAIVVALDSMPKTEGRDEFVKFAVLSDNPVLAGFRAVQSQLYAAFHVQQQPIVRFEHFGEFSCARAKNGALLVITPVDHLIWTEQLAQHITELDNQIREGAPTSRKSLWLTGTLSPLALKNLKALGWRVEQKVMNKLSAAATK